MKNKAPRSSSPALLVLALLAVELSLLQVVVCDEDVPDDGTDTDLFGPPSITIRELDPNETIKAGHGVCIEKTQINRYCAFEVGRGASFFPKSEGVGTSDLFDVCFAFSGFQPTDGTIECSKIFCFDLKNSTTYVKWELL